MLPRLVLFIIILVLDHERICAQLQVGPHFQFCHYTHSQIGGPSAGLTTDFIMSPVSSIQIRGGIGYATGHRGFNKNPDATYSLLDGSAVDEYPFSAPHPGYDEEWYWIVSKLNTAETNEYYLHCLFSFKISQSRTMSLGFQSGVSASWIFDSYIPYTFMGDFSSLFATVDDLSLVTPYFDHFFTVGPIIEVHSSWSISQNLSMSLQMGSTFLLQTGTKFGGGFQFLVRIGA